MGRRPGPSLDRQQVVDAAIRILEVGGPDALGVSRVARELGIKPPSIYNHIGKGDALHRAVAVEGNRRLLQALEAQVRGVVPAREQLQVLAHAVRQWVGDNPSLYALMSRIPPDNDEPDFARTLRRLLDLFSRPLLQMGLPEEDVVHAIRGFRSAVHGFVLLETGAQFGLVEAPSESFDWLVNALLDGLGSPR